MEGVGPVIIPRNLERAFKSTGREEWLSTLQPFVSDLASLWHLRVMEPFQPGGTTAWVAPVEDESGSQLVLKVLWRHYEADHEAEGLRRWGGCGVVRLRAGLARDQSEALLLERCLPGASLSARPEVEQDVVIAGLLRRLWVAPGTGHGFRPLSDMCARWGTDLERVLLKLGVDAGLVRAGLQLWRELPASFSGEVLLFTDLHAGNVLSAQREPWLAIDPKPYVGDPTYDVLQHMLNCERRLLEDPFAFVDRMCGLSDLDPERLRRWLFARSLHEVPRRPVLARLLERLAPS